MAEYPKVEIPSIDNLSLNFKKGVAKISFEVQVIDPQLLKLIFLQATAQPLSVVFESKQAVMDLQLQTVDIKSGEVQS